MPTPPPGTLRQRSIDVDELAETLQSEFSLPQNCTRVYLLLVRTGSLSVEDVAEHLGTPFSEADALLDQMIQRGLIIHATGDPPKFTALHPRMTLTNLFKTYEKEVVQSLRDRRATVDRVVNLLTPYFEDRER